MNVYIHAYKILFGSSLALWNKVWRYSKPCMAGGEGEGESRQEASGHTHTFTKLTTGFGRADRWLWILKPRAVLETEAAHSSIRYRSSALDLLFTKKNPSLLKCPLSSAFHFNSFKQLSGRKTQDTTTCVHHNVPSKSEFHLDRKNSYIRMPWTADVGYATIKWEVCSKIQIVLF